MPEATNVSPRPLLGCLDLYLSDLSTNVGVPPDAFVDGKSPPDGVGTHWARCERDLSQTPLVT